MKKNIIVWFKRDEVELTHSIGANEESGVK